MFCYIKTWRVKEPDVSQTFNRCLTGLLLLLTCECKHTFTHTVTHAAHVLLPFHIFCILLNICNINIVATNAWKIVKPMALLCDGNISPT